MLAHILGWSTLVSIGGIGAGLLYFMFTFSYGPKLAVPRPVAVPLSLSSGSDYVGAV